MAQTPEFETFTTQADDDGDRVNVSRVREGDEYFYMIKVFRYDGHHAAYVTLDDMREIAARVNEVDGL